MTSTVPVVATQPAAAAVLPSVGPSVITTARTANAPVATHSRGTGVRSFLITGLMLAFLAYYIFGLALPAARDGISWARSNLIFIKHATAVVCVICTVGAYVMGQAQLLRRVASALVRLFPARRYPLTDGDRGRDFVAPVAARGLPTAPTRPHDTPATTSATAAPPPQADLYSSFSLAI